jgi:RNA recognition motif-containing protein
MSVFRNRSTPNAPFHGRSTCETRGTFVGGLAPQTTAESMRAFFTKFGKVVDATVMVDRETGRSKGFGFVTFEDNSSDSQLVGKLGTYS